MSSDGDTCNQADHVFIFKKWMPLLIDDELYRGADVASDHNIFVAKGKIKLKKVMLWEEME